jgi:hypothetical protein
VKGVGLVVVMLCPMVHVVVMVHLRRLVVLMMLMMLRHMRMVALGLVMAVPRGRLLVNAAVMVRVSGMVLVLIILIMVAVVMRVHWRGWRHRVVGVSWVQGQVVAATSVVMVAWLKVLRGMHLDFRGHCADLI